ncbi:MAG: hypothetical protein KAJ14_07615, partial [Candidatus Omnitrophica bacterium]|nr:hypothetical protein [Candidatus Omnitrophota bacterium]
MGLFVFVSNLEEVSLKDKALKNQEAEFDGGKERCPVLFGYAKMAESDPLKKQALRVIEAEARQIFPGSRRGVRKLIDDLRAFQVINNNTGKKVSFCGLKGVKTRLLKELEEGRLDYLIYIPQKIRDDYATLPIQERKKLKVFVKEGHSLTSAQVVDKLSIYNIYIFKKNLSRYLSVLVNGGWIEKRGTSMFITYKLAKPTLIEWLVNSDLSLNLSAKDSWLNLDKEKKGSEMNGWLVLFKELTDIYDNTVITQYIAEQYGINPGNVKAVVNKYLDLRLIEYGKLGFYFMSEEVRELISEYETSSVESYDNLPQDIQIEVAQIAACMKELNVNALKAKDISGILGVRVKEVPRKLKRLKLRKGGVII